ncbi:MAG: DUF6232 family protein [Myxococcota bacterium]
MLWVEGLPMEEKTIFERKNVRITDQNAIIEGRKIPLDTITSVTLAREPARRRPLYGLLGVGVGLVSLGVYLPERRLVGAGMVSMALGLLLLAFQRDRFFLFLGNEQGDARAFASRQRELMERVASAIHQALTRKS